MATCYVNSLCSNTTDQFRALVAMPMRKEPWRASVGRGCYESMPYCAQLADFGLSRVLETNGTHVSTQTHGTLAYQPGALSSLLAESKRNYSKPA